MRKIIATILIAICWTPAWDAVTCPATAHVQKASTPGCVTVNEVMTAPFPVNRYTLETLWGVRGNALFVGMFAGIVEYRYPTCAHPSADLMDPNGSHVIVQYNLHSGNNVYMEYQ
jgi:hypothetical protein